MSKAKSKNDTKLYQVTVLYKNGNSECIRAKIDDKALDKCISVVGMCYREGNPGFLLLDGIFVSVSDTCQIGFKEIPPTSQRK